MRNSLCFILIVCLAAISLPAAADGPPDTPPTKDELAQAKRHYQNGVQRYEARDYPAALEAFQDSYRLSHLPDLLFNLSRVSEKLGKPAEAISYLEKYLGERPDAPDAEKIRANIERLKQQLPPEVPETPPVSDKTDKPETPPVPPPEVKPPVPDAAVKTEGPEVGKTSRVPPAAALGLLGGGAALVIIGAALGGTAVAAAHTVEQQANVNSPVPFDSNLQATQQRGQSLTAAGIALDVIGAAALGAGAVWTGVWYYRRGQKARVEASLHPAAAGLHLQGRF